MGFLDHSTNNIIVDAVLTDVGREFLARNDKSFAISQFSLGDDEIDYGIIEQYGRTVGKEKIEKNTPVMEALTRSSMGLKHKAISMGNPFATHMPVYEVTTASSDGLLNFSLSSSVSTATISLSISSNSSDNIIDADVRDESLRVELDSKFLFIQGASPIMLTSDNIAHYEIVDSVNIRTNNLIEASIIVSRKSINNNTFNINSISSSSDSYIRTFIKVIGMKSGIQKTIEARITK